MLSGEEFVFVLPRFVMLEKNCDTICGFKDLWVIPCHLRCLSFWVFQCSLVQMFDVFWGLSMSRREYNDDNDDARLELRNDHDNTRRASIKLRWSQRRRRIKGVNCKQHFLAAPVIHLLIYSFIEWFIHSFMFMAVPLQKEEFRFASKHRWRQGRGEMKKFIITLCAATVCFA